MVPREFLQLLLVSSAFWSKTASTLENVFVVEFMTLVPALQRICYRPAVSRPSPSRRTHMSSVSDFWLEFTFERIAATAKMMPTIS